MVPVIRYRRTRSATVCSLASAAAVRSVELLRNSTAEVSVICSPACTVGLPLRRARGSERAFVGLGRRPGAGATVRRCGAAVASVREAGLGDGDDAAVAAFNGESTTGLSTLRAI